jgi:hypothetical protein
MCYILISTCPACSFPIQTRLKQCSHAELHGFDPRACPNRMKRRRQSDARVCWKCATRRESLSCFPGGEVYDADDESEEGDVVYDADDESEEGDVVSASAGKGVRERKGRKMRRMATMRRK